MRTRTIFEALITFPDGEFARATKHKRLGLTVLCWRLVTRAGLLRNLKRFPRQVFNTLATAPKQGRLSFVGVTHLKIGVSDKRPKS